jgi:hypothetical protein
MSGGQTRLKINGRMQEVLRELLDAGEDGRNAPANQRLLVALQAKELARLDWIPCEDDPSRDRPRWRATETGAAFIGRQAFITA